MHFQQGDFRHRFCHLIYGHRRSKTPGKCPLWPAKSITSEKRGNWRIFTRKTWYQIKNKIKNYRVIIFLKFTEIVFLIQLVISLCSFQKFIRYFTAQVITSLHVPVSIASDFFFCEFSLPGSPVPDQICCHFEMKLETNC